MLVVSNCLCYTSTKAWYKNQIYYGVVDHIHMEIITVSLKYIVHLLQKIKDTYVNFYWKLKLQRLLNIPILKILTKKSILKTTWSPDTLKMVKNRVWCVCNIDPKYYKKNIDEASEIWLLWLVFSRFWVETIKLGVFI